MAISHLVGALVFVTGCTTTIAREPAPYDVTIVAIEPVDGGSGLEHCVRTCVERMAVSDILDCDALRCP